VDDTGAAGQAESVVLDFVSGVTYFVVIDGYANAPPGPTGPYTLTLSAAPGTVCLPVELQKLSIE
jgi:hypothetical protein